MSSKLVSVSNSDFVILEGSIADVSRAVPTQAIPAGWKPINQNKPHEHKANNPRRIRDRPIKAYTSEELRELYTVSPLTWSRWIKGHLDAMAPIDGRAYSAEQVEIIFEKLGAPPAKQ